MCFPALLPPTGRLRGEAEGIEAILLLVFCSVAADAGDQSYPAGGPRLDDGIVDSAVAEPPGVAPVQAFCPGCRGAQTKFYL